MTSSPKPCPQCNSRGRDPRTTMRLLTVDETVWWYGCDLCGYHSSPAPTIPEAARAWQTENREAKEADRA